MEDSGIKGSHTSALKVRDKSLTQPFSGTVNLLDRKI